MQPLFALLPTWASPEHLINKFGAIGVIIIVFAETGLLIGFFLPGDSLLFLAGILARQGDLNLPTPLLFLGVMTAAVLGDQVGYLFGKKAGVALYDRPDSRLFKQKHLQKAHNYFEENGARTIFLARFVPIVRTFAPVVAGVSQMPYRTFVTYNIVGGIAWGGGVMLAGYLFGNLIPEGTSVDTYLLPVVAVIVALSLLPIYFEYRKHKKSQSDDPVKAE